MHFALVKITGRRISGARSKDSALAIHSASPFVRGDGDDDYLLQGSESYVTNHRYPNELHRRISQLLSR